jgi:hypothetical protein
MNSAIAAAEGDLYVTTVPWKCPGKVGMQRARALCMDRTDEQGGIGER